MIKQFLDVIIPRFLDEWVVLVEDENGYYPAFPVSQLEEGERPEFVVKMQVFNFFGFALFPKQVSELTKYEDYLRSLTDSK